MEKHRLRPTVIVLYGLARPTHVFLSSTSCLHDFGQLFLESSLAKPFQTITSPANSSSFLWRFIFDDWRAPGSLLMLKKRKWPYLWVNQSKLRGNWSKNISKVGLGCISSRFRGRSKLKQISRIKPSYAEYFWDFLTQEEFCIITIESIACSHFSVFLRKS